MWTNKAAKRERAAEERTLEEVAGVMATTLPVGVLAGILNQWVTADDDPDYSETCADVAGKLFRLLCKLRPDAVDAATNC